MEEHEERKLLDLPSGAQRLGSNIVENIIGSSQASGKNSSRHQLVESAQDSILTMYTATFVKDSYTDYFQKATYLLKEIIHLETTNLDAFKAQTLLSKRTRKVKPELMDPETLRCYVELKTEYREILRKILDIRSKFTYKLKADISATLHTVQDVAPMRNDWLRVSLSLALIQGSYPYNFIQFKTVGYSHFEI